MAQKRFLIDAGFETNADSVITGNLTVDTVLLDGQDLASAIASASGGAVAQSVSKSGDTMTGDLTMSAHIIPSIDSDGTTGYDLGSPTMKWRDLYLSEGSLYIDGQKVIESNSGTIVVQADVNQSLTTQVTGTGVLTLASASTVNVAATLQMASGKKITDADGTAVKFGDKVDMDNNQIINLAAPTEDGHATNKTYVDAAINGLINGAPGALDTLNELATALGDDANFAATITNSISVAADGATIKADAAELAAIAAAASYTDTAITNNVDFTGYAQESYVDTAEADAVSAAATDATTKADAAQSAAATDATTKADAAQSAAATDATTKADAALVSAKSYADTAEATAASDATTKANAAQAAAIAAVTNGAGAAFDTLVEIQNAMATDSELSSAISSVTSSAAATASADATTKANAALAAAKVYADANDANTNTWRGISNSTSSTSTSVSASSAAVKAAYDRSWPNTTYSVGDGGLSQINFTSADHSKLNGIESGATADQSAAQLLASIKTVDVDGSGGINAGRLDGHALTSAATANTVAERDSAADITARLFRSNYAEQSTAPATTADIAFRNNSTSDNYTRFMTSGAFKSYCDSVGVSVDGHTHSYLGLTAKAADANLLDGVNGASYMRSDATDYQNNTIYQRGYLVNETAYRDRGVYGHYDSTKTNHIWSMGTAYKSSATGVNFGNLYGLAYKHTNNATGGALASGHQMVWCQNGGPTSAMGSNVWTSGDVIAYSDARVKDNLEVIPNAIDKVKQLNGYTYDRTDKQPATPEEEGTIYAHNPKNRYVGVIAQEVLAVLPEAVSGGPNSNEGSEDDHYSVAYGNLVALLIEAIKEQQVQIDELKANR